MDFLNKILQGAKLENGQSHDDTNDILYSEEQAEQYLSSTYYVRQRVDVLHTMPFILSLEKNEVFLNF